MTQASNPEIGQRVRTGAFFSNVHDQGSGPPVLLLHGSGAGVSAWANWRLLLPVLSQGRRVVAPDLPGDPRHRIAEPTSDEITAALRAHGHSGEVELWQEAIKKART